MFLSAMQLSLGESVKDSRPYGKKQSRKEPSVMETAWVTQNKK